MEKQNVRQYAVRLETSIGVGTGFLFAPQGTEYAYIFTVYHVIQDLFEQDGWLLIKYQEKKIYYPYDDKDICLLDSAEKLKQYAEMEDEKNKEVNKDVAVLRILKNRFEETKFKEEFLWLQEELLRPDMDFIGYGYPDRKDIELELSGTVQKWDNRERMINCQADNINYSPFSEAMQGYSGTGLVTEYQGKMAIIGLVARCKGDEMHQVFRAVGISEIIEKIKERGWEFPEVCAVVDTNNRIPEDFFDNQIIELEEECMQCLTQDIKNQINSQIYEINKECVPMKIAQEQNFFDIPKCNEENRNTCKCFWAGYVWKLLIQKILNGDVKEKYFLREEGEKVQLEFICSEGDGKANLAAVVASAINNKVLGEQIAGDSILLWQSEKNPRVLRFQKGRFKNIVEDIASGAKNGMAGKPNRAGYDLLNGEMKEKNYGILHVNYLINRLSDSNCTTLEEAEKEIREALDEIWK